MAAVLEAAEIVEIDLDSPAKVRLSKGIVDGGQPPLGVAGVSEIGRVDPFSRVFGALRGTVAIAPGTDLTAPTGEEWGAAR